MRAPTLAVRLYGQAANQMFQFAFGRAITPAELPVLLDVSRSNPALLYEWLQPGAIRRLSMTEAVRLRRAPLPAFKSKQQNFLDSRKSPRLRRMLDRRVRTEVDWRLVELDLRNAEPPILVQGYFQNEAYFWDRRDEVVEALAPVGQAAIDALREFQTRCQAPAVCVQIRAGADYTRLGWTLDIAWYRTAAERMVDTLGACAFLVTSDDASVAKQFAPSIRDLGPSELLPPLSNYDTLRALSLCDHHIISASTYGWWAAWLADYSADFDPDHHVLHPDPWVQTGAQVPSSRWHGLR